MNTTDLGDLMRAATDGVEPAPDFAQQVLLGGRRRRQRRRTVLAAGAMAVVAAVVGTTIVTLNDTQSTRAADERLSAPTKGDLAGDQAFLGEVTKAWTDGLSIAPEAASGVYDDRLGEPHVFWAGDTPAGRAAIVLQEVEVKDNGQVPTSETGPRTAEGLVAIDPADGALKLVSTRVPGEPELGMAVFYNFGPGDRTMLVVDEGKPLFYSYDFKFEGWGVPIDPKLTWQPIQPHDGVALLSIPVEVNPQSAVAYQGDQPPAQVDWTKIKIDFHVERVAIASEYVARRLDDPSFRTSFLPWQEEWEVNAPLVSPDERRDIRARYHPWVYDTTYVSVWAILAELPDGRHLVAQEIQNPGATPQLWVLTWSNDDTAYPTEAGPVDRTAVLPVKYHIPDGQGWIVAQRGQSLSYRTAPDGQWQDAGRDAALLPEGAVEVKVGEQVVTL